MSPRAPVARSPFGGIGLRLPVGANAATMMLDKASKGLHKGRECVVRPLVEFPLHPTGRVDLPAWRCCGRRSNGELDVGSPALAQADSLPARIGRKPWLFGRWREPGDEGDVAWPATRGPRVDRTHLGARSARAPTAGPVFRAGLVRLSPASRFLLNRVIPGSAQARCRLPRHRTRSKARPRGLMDGAAATDPRYEYG